MVAPEAGGWARRQNPGIEGVGVTQPWRGGWSRPLTLRAPLRAAPGRIFTSRTPPRMAWRTEIPRLLTRRGVDPDSGGGLPLPCPPALLCTMATCRVVHLGELILRILSALWALACGRGGGPRSPGAPLSLGRPRACRQGFPSPIARLAAPEEPIGRSVSSAPRLPPTLGLRPALRSRLR